VDSERCTVTINDPEKNSNPRILKVSNKLISMMNALPKNNIKVFNGLIRENLATNFRLQRKRAAAKLQNPRLLQIHFHTFRHWKATTEYAKTKDILHVMQMLGHKSIQNTLLYTQLIQWESDDYHSAVAKTTEEAQKLIEAGFDYVCTHETLMLFRKRK
jgi:integrase